MPSIKMPEKRWNPPSDAEDGAISTKTLHKAKRNVSSARREEHLEEGTCPKYRGPPNKHVKRFF